MTQIDIKATTFSGGGHFSMPLIDIDSEDFRYSSPMPHVSGIQVTERMTEKEDAIKQHCDKIADELFELYKMVNE